MLGKLRVALSPSQPEWMFTRLFLTARGVTTGPMPWQRSRVGRHAGRVRLRDSSSSHSDGRTRHVPLVPARTIAEIWADLHAALKALNIGVTLNPVPQEVPDVTPMDQDRRPAAYDPAAVQRWFAVATAAAATFDRWRAHFFGRNGIQLWWGALDVALLLFNGKNVAPPADRGYLMRYDLDAEMMNVGFYPGDDAAAPFFYGYIFPQPAGAAQLPIAPATASWSDAIKEWVLPYEAVRTAAASRPQRCVRSSTRSTISAASAAGWDRAALTYVAPKRVLRT